jgi:hypothetical protein
MAVSHLYLIASIGAAALLAALKTHLKNCGGTPDLYLM